MSSKFTKTYFLGAILIVAVLILLIPKFTNKSKEQQTEPQKIFSFEIADIDKIDLEYPDQKNRESGQRQVAQLQKVEDNWIEITNNNYKARENDVKNLLEKVKEITQGELASGNPARQQQLEIDKTKGARVKLWQGESLLADFWLGKSGASGSTTYFRLASSDLVYETKNNIRFYFTKSDWIDKLIWKLDKEQINKIVLNVDWQKIILEKQETTEETTDETDNKNKWRATSPRNFDADDQKVTSLINTLSNLSAQEIVFDKTVEEAGLTANKSKISVYLADRDNPNELIIGSKIEVPELEKEEKKMAGLQDGYYVKMADSDQIFTIGAYMVENIFTPKLDDLEMQED